MKRQQRLRELNNNKGSNKAILLFIAEVTADNGAKLSWLIGAVGVLIALFIALLVKGV